MSRTRFTSTRTWLLAHQATESSSIRYVHVILRELYVKITIYQIYMYLSFSEMLESQTGLMQSTPHELREKCFIALHSALVSNSGHLLKLGLMGVQVLPN